MISRKSVGAKCKLAFDGQVTVTLINTGMVNKDSGMKTIIDKACNGQYNVRKRMETLQRFPELPWVETLMF